MRSIFLQLPFVIALVAVAVAAALGALAYLVVMRTPFFRALEKTPLVAPFMTATTTMFALFLTFVASDAWTHYDRAVASLSRETAALTSLALIAVLPPTGQRVLVEPLRAYVRTTLAEEWRAPANLQASPAATRALEALRIAVYGQARAPGIDASIWTASVHAADELEIARAGRLALAEDAADDFKWGLLLALAFVAMLAVAAAHRDRPAAGRVALALFCTATAIALTLVAGYEYPYVGLGAVTPDPIAALAQRLG